jgi:hypothetical protein
MRLKAALLIVRMMLRRVDLRFACHVLNIGLSLRGSDYALKRKWIVDILSVYVRDSTTAHE